jgi:sulfoacetaldehyde dehydrogenase
MRDATIVMPVSDTGTVIAQLVSRARSAMQAIAGFSQSEVNDLVAAVAWACYEPGNALRLAQQAVADTGLGCVEDKVQKNRRKTFGTLRDLLDPEAKSVGIIREEPQRGLTFFAKPVGVVAAICPSTNPSATPTNKTMMALKGRNAVIIAPSPKGTRTCELLLEFIHAELNKLGAPRDLVQMLPPPASKEMTAELMRACDLVVVTGSQSNVRAGYESGKPAIGVGAGNVPVIVEADAALEDAAEKIYRSKVFDYATSCSSENSVIIEDRIYDAMIEAFRKRGGYLLSAAQKAQLERALFQGSKLNPRMIAQSPATIAREAGLTDPAASCAEFFLVEEDGVGSEHPFSGEKLCVVLTLYRYRRFDEAVELVKRILAYQGAGHSCGIHTANERHVEQLGAEIDVVRVIVNQSHCFANGGSFDNGLNFTLSMGCGTWAGNSISENLSYRHFLNITHVVRPIPPRVPSEEDLFGAYWSRVAGA